MFLAQRLWRSANATPMTREASAVMARQVASVALRWDTERIMFNVRPGNAWPPA
jgi:hypothetical protein